MNTVSKKNMNISYVKNNIYDGMVFNKVKGKSNIIKVIDDGFYYAIGKVGNKKKVKFEEIEEAIIEVERTGQINRKWYVRVFPKCAKNNPCNFTSVGGVLEALGYVEYIKSSYVKLNKK